MPRVKIEGIIEKIDINIRHALRDAVNESLPNVEFDEYELFRAFRRAIRRKCSTWERVPGHLIENEE